MYCKNCGKEIKETAKFCPACGYKVSEEQMTIKKTKLSFIVLYPNFYSPWDTVSYWHNLRDRQENKKRVGREHSGKSLQRQIWWDLWGLL